MANSQGLLLHDTDTRRCATTLAAVFITCGDEIENYMTKRGLDRAALLRSLLPGQWELLSLVLKAIREDVPSATLLAPAFRGYGDIHGAMRMHLEIFSDIQRISLNITKTTHGAINKNHTCCHQSWITTMHIGAKQN